jgi:hypothetical protein
MAEFIVAIDRATYDAVQAKDEITAWPPRHLMSARHSTSSMPRWPSPLPRAQPASGPTPFHPHPPR